MIDTSHQIRTEFKRKGRASKHEGHRKQMARLIRKERASRLEGSFGKEKEHYYLKKIKARTQKIRNTLDIFWDTYCQCPGDRPQNGQGGYSKSSLIVIIINM